MKLKSRLAPVIISASLVLSSCAKDLTYPEFSQDFEKDKLPRFEHVIFDFQAECKDDGDECIVTSSKLDAAEDAISNLNTTIDHLVDSNNLKIDAISHFKYEIELLKRANEDLKSQIRINSYICAGKQVLLLGICGAGIAF